MTEPVIDDDAATDAQFAQQLDDVAAARFGGLVDDTDPSLTPDPGADDGNDSAPVVDDPNADPADDPNAFDPSAIDANTFNAYREFTEFVGQNPEFARYVASFPGLNPYPDTPDPRNNPRWTPPPSSGVQGQGATPLASGPVTPFVLPDDVDPEDPAIKALLPVIQQQQEMLASIQQQSSITQQQLYAREAEQIEALANTAKGNFKTTHSLDDKDMESIHASAIRLGVIPSYMSGVDPISGLPVRPDPINALTRAYEIAMMQTPAYREKVIAAEAGRDKNDKSRKRKLSAISGNSGSSPRTSAAPRNDAERRTAMIAEVAAAMNGNG